MTRKENEIFSLILFAISTALVVTLIMWTIYNDFPTRNTEKQRKEYKYKDVKDSNFEDLEPGRRLFYENLNGTR